MVAEYYGQSFSLSFIKNKCQIKKAGASMLSISKTAKAIGFYCIGAKMDIEQLKDIVQDGPAILHWAKNHFVVIYKTPKPKKRGIFYVADPAKGLITYKEAEFRERWMNNWPAKRSESGLSSNRNLREPVGYTLLLEPTPQFFKSPAYPVV
jgi:ATP-binding cassette subfamily B protein